MDGVIDVNTELNEMGSQLPRSVSGKCGVVPDLYFEQLSDRCLDVIKNSGEEDCPIWQVADKQTFKLPEGYFEQLPQIALEAVKGASKEHKTVVKAFPIKVQWAAAAMIALVISLGGYWMFTAPVQPNPEVILATVPLSDLSDYVAITYGEETLDRWGNAPAVPMQLTTEEIQAYVDERGWD